MAIGRLWGLFLAALSVTGFAATFVFGSALTKEHGVSPEVLTFLRFAIAGSAMAVAGSVTADGRRRLRSPAARDWLTMLWLAPVGTSIMAWCVFMGCARVSTANASMADALTPLMIFGVNALLQRRIDRHGLVGLVCGLVGALLVIQIVHSGGIALSAYSTGDVFVLMSAAVWGVYTVCGRRLNRRFGASVFSTWTMLIGAAMIGIICLLGNFSWPRTLHAWTLTVGLGLFSTLLPFWTWNAAQRYLPISLLAVTAYFTPIVAVALGVIFLNEGVTPLQWLGTAFVIASALVETRRSDSPSHK